MDKIKNWGQIKGGLNSSGNTKTIKIPLKDEKLAEFIGIILGDGNIHEYKKGKKVRVYNVRIAGDYRYDYEYLTNYVAKLSKELFDLEPKFHKQRGKNTIYLSLYGIKLVQYLTNMGLKPGNKIKNKLTIPKWIWKRNSYLRACIRGLYDTDGSVYELLPHWPGLFQIYFSNGNLILLKDVRKALIQLGYDISKISKINEGKAAKIYITRKDQVKKFYKNIGFKNAKHNQKLEKLYSPVV